MTVSSRSLMNQWWRLGGLAGILYVVLFVIGILIEGDTPMPDNSASDIKQYFVDNGDKFMIGDFIIGIGFVFFFLPFASALGSFLGRSEGEPPVWSRLIFFAAITFTAIGAAASSFLGALAYTAGDFTDDNLLKSFVDANYYAFTTAGPLLAGLLVLSASIVILRTKALWQWLGWLGLIFTIAAVISSLSVLNDDPNSPLGIMGFIVFISYGVWILIASVGMWLKEAPPEPMM